MKQIVITPAIEKAAETYADSLLFVDKRSDFVPPLDGLRNLITDLQEVNDGLVDRDRYVKYVEKIVADFDDLITLKPSQFDTYKKAYDKILNRDQLSGNVNHRGLVLPDVFEEREKMKIKTGVFYKEIVERMRYKDCRTYLSPRMKEIGINTCVYCNLFPALSSIARNEAYFPFDHWRPKSKYPFLCINFYNLNPICPECNEHKQDDDKKGYQLYVERPEGRDPFVFEINRNKLVEGDPSSIEVQFKARKVADDELRENYNEWYRIEAFYNDDEERDDNYKMVKDIDNHRGSYLNATEASFPAIVDRKKLFQEVLGVKEDEGNIFTNVKKKLKLDTAKDAKLI